MAIVSGEDQATRAACETHVGRVTKPIAEQVDLIDKDNIGAANKLVLIQVEQMEWIHKNNLHLYHLRAWQS